MVWRPAVGNELGGRRARVRDYLRGAAPIDAPRLLIGGLLFVFALAALLHTFEVLHSLRQSIWAVAIVATMLGLLAGPWFVRLGRSLASERAARIREQERAEVAAHLHDSVLQTLTLIQKRAGDARQVATLARRQERELRRWLFELPRDAGESVRIMLERAAGEVEELHGVPIETVIVGDAAPDPQLEALVLAAREALTNAAKFSGAERVDLYAEIEPGRVEAFVRDRGVGFDCSQIPADRHGVRDSIVGRMRRHGGVATVRSEPGRGTEVELVLEPVHRDGGQVAMRPVAPR
jgi:signal transduction histidine kinase